MQKIGVIADTHDTLKPEVIGYLQQCDTIIHAGDVTKPEILNTLKSLHKELYVVKGNNDTHISLPKASCVQIAGYWYYIVHDKKDIPKDISAFDFIIYGHSHKYEEYKRQGIQYLNPGGCGRRRFSLPLTMAIITLETETYTISSITLR